MLDYSPFFIVHLTHSLCFACSRQREARKGKAMADPTIFSYSLLDDEGLKSNTSFPVAYDGSTETIDALIGAWLSYGGLINATIDAKITGGQILIPLERDASWKSSPAEGNNVNQVMNLNFDNDFNSYATSILLPGYKESQLNADGSVNLAATALAALIAAIIAGYSSEVFPNSTALHDLNALRDAFLTVRKVRNQKAGTISRP
jgi:hypothetical protein